MGSLYSEAEYMHIKNQFNWIEDVDVVRNEEDIKLALYEHCTTELQSTLACSH